MVKTGIIYIATNLLNKKQYVGQTTQNLNIRKRRGYNPYFQNAIEKHGESIVWEIKGRYPLDRLDSEERSLIKSLNTLYPNGYNFESGGHKNKTLSEETKEKMSIAQQKRPPISDETRKKMSEVHKGHTHNRGRKLSNEHKAKLREIHLGNTYNSGRKHSEETKRKISESLKGNKNGKGNYLRRKHTEESKRKMSEAKKGKKHVCDYSNDGSRNCTCQSDR